MVKLQLPKLATRVRFPLPAPEKSTCESKCFFQRCVPLVRNEMCPSGVMFDSQVMCPSGVKRNTSLHIAPQVQYITMP